MLNQRTLFRHRRHAFHVLHGVIVLQTLEYNYRAHSHIEAFLLPPSRPSLHDFHP